MVYCGCKAKTRLKEAMNQQQNTVRDEGASRQVAMRRCALLLDDAGG